MKLFLFFLLLLFTLPCFSQETTPVLEREVSIMASNQTLESVLNNMSFQAGFVFSYSPEAINYKRNVNLNIKDKSVRYTLNYLFKEENVEYKVRGKYIILKKKSESKEDMRIYEGYVYDSQTGKRLTEASVYDKSLLASAVTDKYGYFSMEIPANAPIKSLQISKLGYSDTLFVSVDSMVRHRNIEINMQQDDTARKSLIDFEKIKPGWIVSDKIKINARNITEPVFRTTQFSLIPYLSTNKFLGGVAINDFSINATVGYVQGIRKFEAGGIMNFVREDVSYFQAAGIANMVGGNLTGFQAAGIFNMVNKVKGFQAAGIFNDAHSVSGAQAAGIYNMSKDTATVQLAGIFNRATQNVVQAAGIYNQATNTNSQTAGLVNVSRESAFQIAGFANITDTLYGGQIAGFMNTTKSSSALQIAGAINVTKGDAQVQIAGLLNKADDLKSFQLAALNFADTASGTVIGLFSFIRKGYHKLEISADESFPFNVAFRTGTQKFHTYLTAGTSSFNFSQFLWNVGYGLGTSLGNPYRTMFDIDLSSNEVFYGNSLTGTNHLYKLYLGFDTKLAGKMSIAYGISYNFLLSDSFIPDYNQISSRLPFYSLTSTDFSNGHNLKSWIGAKVGLRFF